MLGCLGLSGHQPAWLVAQVTSQFRFTRSPRPDPQLLIRNAPTSMGC